MANNDDSNNRGFAAMSEEEHREISSKGGHASSGSFKPGSKRASDAGKKGAANQPTEAKREGGKHSHDNDNK